MSTLRATRPGGVAGRVAHLLSLVLDGPLPIGVRAWDGTTAGPDEPPYVVLRGPDALRHLVWSPGELGLARAYVGGSLDVEGDLVEALSRVVDVLPPGGAGTPWHELPAVLAGAGSLGALVPRPRAPAEELRRRHGRRHSPRRDEQVVRHHYDVGNDFYRLLLGPTLVYSCAWFTAPRPWPAPESELDEAQLAKLDLVCRKLGLRPGALLLDVGCGWGSLMLHAATEYGVTGVGVTLSPEQAEAARARVAAAGLDDQVEVRVQDYRAVDPAADGPFDAVASIGMAEHVGRARFAEYAERLTALVRPGGRVLDHQITSHERRRPPHPFIDRYVFPDGELLRLEEVVGGLTGAGLEVRDVQALREHYPRTLRHWLTRLESHWDEAVALVGPGRARVWRLYVAASVRAFESGRIGVDQVLAVRPTSDGDSGLALGADPWRSPRTTSGTGS